MDIESFDVMWDLSEHGRDTEEYFLRLPQTELYCRHMYPSFEGFPDVSFPVPIRVLSILFIPVPDVSLLLTIILYAVQSSPTRRPPTWSRPRCLIHHPYH